MCWIKGLGIAALGIVMVILPFSIVAQDDTGESHRQTVVRIIEEAFNQGNLDVINEVFASDYINHDASGVIVDRESLKSFISALRSAMPDLEITMDMLIIDGDWTSFRFVSSGTFENELSLFPGLPPTGETVELTKHITLRFNDDGQIAEEWSLTDNQVYLTQLGVLPPMEPKTTEIFAIGQEDRSWQEFRSTGLSEITEFTCTAGADCTSEMFPEGLNLAGLRLYEYSSVEHITIQFNLDQTYNYVVLHLARAGSETLVVTIDGERTYYVTNEMSGSAEDGKIGAYDLRLGVLEEGVHTIQLSVANDGKGNGTFGWDALSLFAM